MQETMGKRISANRKRLGLTQDKLAEQLGVTAQAVSKWENDQACPDIATLPKLAAIFGITTDALLGIENTTVHQAEVVSEGPVRTDDDDDESGNGWEFHWDGGRRGKLSFAIWVLLTGGLLLLSNIMDWDAGLWDLAWPTGLLVFGISGLFPRLSFFRLGCTLFGGYFLLNRLNVPMFEMGSELLLPVFLLLFGISLLAEAFRKGKKRGFRVVHKGRNGKKTHTECYNTEDRFHCNVSFGEHHHCADVPMLRGGEANLSFGELTVDLRSCREVADGCTIEANCSFGELELLVPRRFAVRSTNSATFGSVDIDGEHDSNPQGIIYLEANVSFGDISIEYV